MKGKNIIANFSLYRNIDINEVNSLIDNVARNRYQNVDYVAINNLALKILQIPPQKIQPNISHNFQYTLSKDEVIKIVLDFFKSIDLDFYKKAQAIINGEEKDISLNFFETVNSNDNNYETRKKNEAKVEHVGNVKKINIPSLGNINDVYNMVHEISHTFDLPKSMNLSRVMLADVNSECFERMLDCYFEERKDIEELLKQDIDLIRNDSINRTYFSALDYAIKYSFFNYKNYNGIMSLKDIKQVMSKFTLPPNLVLDYLRDNSQDMSYSSRYILGGIASEEYLQQYRQNPKESVEKLKRYMELIKEDEREKALKELGVNMNTIAYEKEIERINSKRNNEKTKDNRIK